ncbi:MAG TPA: hypothetical protein VFB62_01130 [Polyangiaceae bacterium]|nr:hypothetical protein [Polyangiaceae bacterium]
MSLSEHLSESKKREEVIDDCVALVDREVQGKSGLGGIVIKTGYKAVKGIRPGFIRSVVNSLFDDWVRELDPIWKEARDEGKKPHDHFDSERSRVADALLSVTDGKADSAKSALVKSTYKKLRPTAKKHVEDAVPGLASVLERHVTA